MAVWAVGQRGVEFVLGAVWVGVGVEAVAWVVGEFWAVVVEVGELEVVVAGSLVVVAEALGVVVVVQF